jgi:regulator of sigma E protease
MTYLVGALGLALLVLIHEAGHFFTARAVGMTPRRFYVGFPPALVRTRRKGIEYGIGAIPLGGYVKIPGMHRPAPSDLDLHLGGAVQEAPQLVGLVERMKRLLAAGNFDEAATDLPALEACVERAKLSPAARRGAERGLRELKDSIAADAYWRQPTWKRVAVIAAGPGTNFLFAVLLLAFVFYIGEPAGATREVGKVFPGSPAAQVGLEPGDVIVAVNGAETPTFGDISDRIRGSHGRPISVSVIRDGRRIELATTRPMRGGEHSWIFGFRPQPFYQRHGPLESVGLASRQTWHVTEAIGQSLARLVRGRGEENLTSPVGIVRESGRALEVGFRFYIQLLALISLSLALLNLLPLLPLDGGHIVISLIEGVRRRAIAREVYERVSIVGIALVVMLFVIGLSNDLGGTGGG